ncbi:hypothetical protein AAHA92_14784 [Salvia divinorum]|uniref:Uncharacterized protein n=1 Tax=Salvia divinorum TaxID=28513 RepID=A0ABD1HGK2_SALDI
MEAEPGAGKGGPVQCSSEQARTAAGDAPGAAVTEPAAGVSCASFCSDALQAMEIITIFHWRRSIARNLTPTEFILFYGIGSIQG